MQYRQHCSQDRQGSQNSVQFRSSISDRCCAPPFSCGGDVCQTNTPLLLPQSQALESNRAEPNRKAEKFVCHICANNVSFSALLKCSVFLESREEIHSSFQRRVNVHSSAASRQTTMMTMVMMSAASIKMYVLRVAERSSVCRRLQRFFREKPEQNK